MKQIKLIAKTLLTPIIIFLLPIVAFLLVTSKLPVFGIQSFVVLSGSMEPLLNVGGVVFTQSQPKYNKFDVITFQKENIFVTHRFVGIAKDGSYITKGDANNAPDSAPVAPRQVLGKTIFFIPYIGFVVEFAKTIPGLILFVFMPALLFIAFELANIKKELEKEIEKKLMKRMENTQVSV